MGYFQKIKTKWIGGEKKTCFPNMTLFPFLIKELHNPSLTLISNPILLLRNHTAENAFRFMVTPWST